MQTPDRTRDEGTCFATSGRETTETLERQIGLISKNPVIDALLSSVGGSLAVLNGKRQIVALNADLLKTLGIDDARQALGLRYGEAAGCVFSSDPPDGCGTGEHCSTCGALMAVLISTVEDKPIEKVCTIKGRRAGRMANFNFRARAVPIVVGDERFVLLFLQDISVSYRRAALERVFLHDLSNTVSALAGTCDLIDSRTGDGHTQALERIRSLTARLAAEVSIQQLILRSDPWAYRTRMGRTTVARLFGDLQIVFECHPVSRDKTLRLAPIPPGAELVTDGVLLGRILANMVTNAFEATPVGGEVRVSAEARDDVYVFSVWNAGAIRPEIARRVFQRNFSTKDGEGRGLGTYCMKLLGEEILHGEVDFATSEAGTVFRIELPSAP